MIGSRRAAVATVRLVVGVFVLGVLTYTFGVLSRTHGISLLDYFGFFTNLTSLLAALVLIVTGVTALVKESTVAARRSPGPPSGQRSEAAG